MNNLKCGNSPGLLVSGPPLSAQYLRRSRFGGWGKGLVSCLRSFNRIYNRENPQYNTGVQWSDWSLVEP